MQRWTRKPESPYLNWLADIRAWRAERLVRIGYRDDEYRRSEFQWTQRNFIAPQVMVEDRYPYDPTQHQYTVNRYLRDLDERYGGIDSVLIWPVYQIWVSTIAICSISTAICRAVYRHSEKWSKDSIAET